MVDKAKILAGRKAIEDYREAHATLPLNFPPEKVSEEHAPLLEKMLSELKALGFNSLEEFAKGNKQANLEALQAWSVFEEECDFCAGRKRACFPDCYAEQSEPLEAGDAPTPTGRKRPALDQAARFDTLSYWEDYYKDKLNAEVGDVFPLFPGCSINRRIVAKPELDFLWR